MFFAQLLGDNFLHNLPELSDFFPFLRVVQGLKIFRQQLVLLRNPVNKNCLPVWTITFCLWYCINILIFVYFCRTFIPTSGLCEHHGQRARRRTLALPSTTHLSSSARKQSARRPRTSWPPAAFKATSSLSTLSAPSPRNSWASPILRG